MARGKVRPVVVDGVTYPTLSAAARANYIDSSSLSVALRKGNATCGGLAIGYADETDAEARRSATPRSTGTDAGSSRTRTGVR